MKVMMRSFLALLGVLWALPAVAQIGQSEMLIPNRPASSAYAVQEVRPRMLTTQGDIISRLADVAAEADEIKLGIGDPMNAINSNPRLSPIDRGVGSPAQVGMNHLTDLTRIGATNPGRWFKCMKVKLVGICIKITISGISFHDMWSYYLPYQKVENVDQPLKTKYYPKVTQKPLIRPAREVLDLQAPRFTGIAARSAGNSANWVMTRYLANPQLPSVSIGDTREDAVDDVNDTYGSDKYRLRNPDRTAAARYNEYHVMPTFAEVPIEIYGQLASAIYYGINGSFRYIHNRKLIGVYNSDWPGLNLIAHNGFASYLWFPIEMGELYGVPFLGIGAFPQICSGLNMRRRGSHKGRTPLDLLLQTPPSPGIPNPFSSLYDRALLAASASAQGRGCLGYNQGPWVPVTNNTPTTYRTAAAAVGTAKGLNIARRMFPGSFYAPLLKESGKFKDRIQWIRNEGMYQSLGRQCGPLERFPTEYRLGNIKPTDPSDDNYVAVHWKYFRGCTAGKPFIIFDGLGRTQIRD